MPKYVKAVKGWKFKLGEQGLAGTETYHRDDGNPTPGVTLPTVGSTPFVDPGSGSTFPYCICTSEEGEFPEGDDTAVTYRYEYTTLRNEFKNDPAARKRMLPAPDIEENRRINCDDLHGRGPARAAR